MRLRSNVRVSTWKEPPLAPAARATTTMPHGRQRRRFNNKCAMIVLIGFVALCFLSVAGNKRSHHNLRQTMPETRCDISSYPLWKLSDFKELDLSGCGNTLNLPDDPKIWASFSSLKKLDLNNNQLNILPKSIEKIPSLEILFLSYNEFQAIPELNEMKKLRVLSLRGNLITNLSSSNLPTATLEWLILTNNRIQTIDANIKELKLLKKLMLSHNNISEIPDELGLCHNLELIRLADNNILSVPAPVLELSKLAWISLSANPFSSLQNTSTQEAKVIKESDIEIYEDVLGSGASGKVYKGRYQGEDVAVKIFKAISTGSDGNSEDEANINNLIDTPFAISALGVIPAQQEEEGGKYKGMVMKLLDGTYPMGKVPSFQTVTRDEGAAPHATNLSTSQVMGAIWNVAHALDYIHSHGICHGDIYLHNVLRDGEGIARLSDWGASFVYDPSAEVASKIEKIEVLAFGRLVQDLFKWNLNVAVPDSTELGSHFNSKSGDKTISLIASILQTEQSKRPTFSEIKETLATIPEFNSFNSVAGSRVT